MTLSSNAPKFNMAHNPVYQIDFSAVESGKRITASKRRVRFRFGFSNAEAIDAGLSGSECRGEEHEVTLVWSLTSGKRLVLADGHEVHFSKGNLQQTKFDTSWTMRGGHTVKIVAHAAPPLFHTPGFRQFELFMDGMSFFQMPKIYELGKSNGRSMVPRAPTASTSGYNNYSLPPQEEAQYQEYVAAHEQRRHLDYAPSFATVAEEAPAAPARPEEAPRADSMPMDLMSEPTPVLGTQDHLSAPVPLFEQGGASSQYDEFAPVEPAPEPAPTMANVHAEILTAYGGPPPPSKPALPALAMEPHTHMVTPTNNNTTSGQQAFFPPATANTTNLVSPVSDISTTPSHHYSPPPPYQPYGAPVEQQQQQFYHQPPPPPYAPPQEPQQYYQQPAPAQYAVPAPAPEQYQQQPAPAPQEQQPPVKLTMMEYHHEELPAEPEKVESALKNLVNLDDITQDPDTPEKQRIAREEEKRQAELAKKHSKPVPPQHGAWHLGPSPCLDKVKETAPPRAPPQREVMRTHAFDPAAAQAGMMVVYGQAAPMRPQYSHSQIGGMGFGAAYAY